jgi:hypothetical protein
MGPTKGAHKASIGNGNTKGAGANNAWTCAGATVGTTVGTEGEYDALVGVGTTVGTEVGDGSTDCTTMGARELDVKGSIPLSLGRPVAQVLWGRSDGWSHVLRWEGVLFGMTNYTHLKSDFEYT